MSKFLDPKNDFAFKKIFGTEKNKDILIPFLNDIFGFEGDARVQDVTFLKTSQDPEIAYKRQSIVDVLCQDQLGRHCIIEMQVVRTRGFEKRAQYYAARAYINQRNATTEYGDLKEVIFLAITDFIMFPDKSAYKSDHVVLDKETHEHDLKDFSFTFLELPKFQKTLSELSTNVEKWAYFFKYANATKEEDVQNMPHDPVQQAYEALNQFSWSEAEMDIYEREEKNVMDARAILAAKIEDAEAKGEAKGLAIGLATGMAKGLEEGKAEGEKAKAMEVARNLKSMNLTVEQIKAATGLTEAEIRGNRLVNPIL